jgi:hypothetical protein
MPKKKPALTREAPEERAPLEVTFKEISWEAQQELVTQLDRFLSAYSRRGETGERAAYQEALWAAYGAMQAVAMSCGRYDPGCMEWFRYFMQMLEDLDTGLVSPVLDCNPPEETASPPMCGTIVSSRSPRLKAYLHCM